MKIFRLVFPLAIISAVCAAILAYVNTLTEGPIRNIASLKANAAARTVLPSETKSIDAVIDPADAVKVFIGFSDADKKKICGYAVPGNSKNGYGGEIKLMVGLTAQKEVVTYRVLQANETPGLGSKLNEQAFVAQFGGKPGSALKVKKDGGDIEAITGATITSRAVCGAIADACKRIDRIEGRESATETQAQSANEGTIVLDVNDKANVMKVLPKGTADVRLICEGRFPTYAALDAQGKIIGYAAVGTGRGRGPDGEIVVHMLCALTAEGKLSRNKSPIPVNKLSISSVDMVSAQSTAINAAMKDAESKISISK